VKDYVLAVVACGLTTLVATPLREQLELANTVMLFLLTVLIAVRLGKGPQSWGPSSASYCSTSSSFRPFRCRERRKYLVTSRSCWRSR
jgi:K+-sensing histidine kinase KdpD